MPLSSVSASGQQAYVMVVNADNTVRKVPVTLGEYGRDSVPVLEWSASRGFCGGRRRAFAPRKTKNTTC